MHINLGNMWPVTFR